ncbi:MAG: 3-phosphoshikimate 1-carboxyvinyltransferase [Flavobacteriales bacterium]
MILRVWPSTLKGTVHAPASKSVMQRLIAGALLADGTSTIHHISESDDCTSALLMAAQLGADIEIGENTVRITGHGVPMKPRSSILEAGESGLAARLFSPIACLTDQKMVLEAKGTLAKRPMDVLQEPLEKLGAAFRSTEGHCPIELSGPLLGGAASLDGSLSSQFLTGLLMALPTVEKDTELVVNDLVSQPYVEMTLNILEDFGIDIKHDDAFEHFIVRGGQVFSPIETAVDGDWSGAAFLLVAGMIAAESSIELEGLNNQYPQADEAIRGALLFAGGALSGSDDGVQVAKRPVRAFQVDLTHCPDLFPPLAALAAFAKKPCTLRGVHRLIHKESNRAETLMKEFEKLGIAVVHNELEDTLVVEPWKQNPSAKTVRISSHGDHRIAMAGAVIALAAQQPIEIEGAECVAKSYPAFFDDLEVLGARIEWVAK